jgi:hypothetical protein
MVYVLWRWTFTFWKLYVLELLRCVQLRFVTLHHVTFTLCCFTLCSNIKKHRVFLSVSPLDPALLKLLGHHEEGVGLAVGGGVGAEVVHVQPLHHARLWPLVVHVQLHPVRHVVRHAAVAQLH